MKEDHIENIISIVVKRLWDPAFLVYHVELVLTDGTIIKKHNITELNGVTDLRTNEEDIPCEGTIYTECKKYNYSLPVYADIYYCDIIEKVLEIHFQK